MYIFWFVFCVSVSLYEASSTCVFFNETICQTSTAECDKEQLVSCDVYNGITGCYVLWGNNTEGLVAVRFQGCFSGYASCDHKELCINSGKFEKDRFFCCCNSSLCNRNFYWYPTSQPSDEPNSDERIRRNVGVIACMVFLPVAIICILTITAVYRRQKHLYSEQAVISNVENNPGQIVQDVPLGRIDLVELRAKGRFGYVWKGECEGRSVAVKIFSFQHKQSWSAELEIYALSLLNHENILHFIGTEKREHELEYWLVTSYHENGSLYDYLKANIITWEQLRHIGHTMMKGLSHLHEEIRSKKQDGLYKPAIAHRDFKSSNVLLKDDLTACVADFGLAVIFKRGHVDGPLAQVGTARYMAPEVLAGAVNMTKDSFLRIDMYSCGLVLWELLSRCSTHEDNSSEFQLPFEKELGRHPSLNDLHDFVVHNKRRPIIRDAWRSNAGLSSLCDTIEECWDEDTDSRLSAACVIERFARYLCPSAMVTLTNSVDI